MAITTENIHNICIVGHSTTGKTTIIDALAFQAGATSRFGKVSDGTSISDYQPDEIEKKTSVSTTLVSFEHKGKKLNFLDTPGFQDFIGEAVSALRAVDIALIVIGADEGIHFSTKKIIKEATKDSLGKIFFINKLDKSGTDYELIYKLLKETLKTGVVPLEIPIGTGEKLIGVVNLLNMKAYETINGQYKEMDIPDNMKAKADEFRLKMVEGIAEGDDKLIEKYLAGESLTDDEIHAALDEGMLKGKISAVLCGSAEKQIGVSSLLDIIDFYMPTPADRQQIDVTDLSTGDVDHIKIDALAPLTALIFKTFTEPHLGDLNFVRIFSGTLKSGQDVKNSSKNITERIGQMYSMFGKEKKELKEAVAGDVVVLVKLRESSVGQTLCDMKMNIQFPTINFPKPVLDMALVTKDKSDDDKLSMGLHKLLSQDPTLRLRIDPELKQTILSGMGEQHIEMVKKQLLRKFNIHIELEKPKVAYRETIKKHSKAQGRHKKQSGGHGQFGDCWIEIEPLPLQHQKDFEFEDKIFGGAIPGKYVPSVEKGILEAMGRGILAGYPVIKVKAAVVDGSYHSVDSSDIAFQIAGAIAFKAAAEKASPVILEPINKVKIYVSDTYLGDVMGNLNSRRGKISGMDDEDGMKMINAFVPDAEMYKYANDLRSLTQGTGTFEMEFDHYEEVPHDLSVKIIEQAQKNNIE